MKYRKENENNKMKNLTCIIMVAFVLLGCKNHTDKNKIIHPNEISIIENNELESDTNNILLSEFIFVNENFKYILETSIEEYNECEKIETGYYFSISIQNTKIKDSLGVKSVYIAIDSVVNNDSLSAKNLYISRSYYKGFVSRGYGFFYYKENLFILDGQYLEDIFKKTNTKKSFSYKCEPVVIFDPPRWLYCYWHKKFYFVYSSPCGG